MLEYPPLLNFVYVGGQFEILTEFADSEEFHAAVASAVSVIIGAVVLRAYATI